MWHKISQMPHIRRWVDYSYPLDTTGLVVCLRSGHMAPKPHYKERHRSGSNHVCLGQLHIYAILLNPKQCQRFFKT